METSGKLPFLYSEKYRHVGFSNDLAWLRAFPELRQPEHGEARWKQNEAAFFSHWIQERFQERCLPLLLKTWKAAIFLLLFTLAYVFVNLGTRSLNPQVPISTRPASRGASAVFDVPVFLPITNENSPELLRVLASANTEPPPRFHCTIMFAHINEDLLEDLSRDRLIKRLSSVGGQLPFGSQLRFLDVQALGSVVIARYEAVDRTWFRIVESYQTAWRTFILSLPGQKVNPKMVILQERSGEVRWEQGFRNEELVYEMRMEEEAESIPHVTIRRCSTHQEAQGLVHALRSGIHMLKKRHIIADGIIDVQPQKIQAFVSENGVMGEDAFWTAGRSTNRNASTN